MRLPRSSLRGGAACGFGEDSGALAKAALGSVHALPEADAEAQGVRLPLDGPASRARGRENDANVDRLFEAQGDGNVAV